MYSTPSMSHVRERSLFSDWKEVDQDESTLINMTNHGTLDENVLAALGIVNSYSWKIQKSTSDRKTASVALFSIIVVEGHGSKRISSWYFDLYIVGRLACPDSIQFQFILFLNSLTQMKSAD